MDCTDRLLTATSTTLAVALFGLFWMSYGLDGALTAMIAVTLWVSLILWLCKVWGVE